MPIFTSSWNGKTRTVKITKGKRKFAEFTVPPSRLPKKKHEEFADSLAWRLVIGAPPTWLARQLKLTEERIAKEEKKHPKPARSTGGGYQPGKSCGPGEHKWENRSTYLKCTRCKATRTLKRSEPAAQTRRRVEKL